MRLTPDRKRRQEFISCRRFHLSGLRIKLRLGLFDHMYITKEVRDMNQRRRQTKEQRKEYHQTCRLHVLQKYGGCCVYCKSDEAATLTIDHKNDNGATDKWRNQSRKFYYVLRVSPRRDDLQLMCFNCQWRKRIYGSDMTTWESKKVSTSVKARPLRVYPQKFLAG